MRHVFQSCRSVGVTATPFVPQPIRARFRSPSEIRAYQGSQSTGGSDGGQPPPRLGWGQGNCHSRHACLFSRLHHPLCTQSLSTSFISPVSLQSARGSLTSLFLDHVLVLTRERPFPPPHAHHHQSSSLDFTVILSNTIYHAPEFYGYACRCPGPCSLQTRRASARYQCAAYTSHRRASQDDGLPGLLPRPPIAPVVRLTPRILPPQRSARRVKRLRKQSGFLSGPRLALRPLLHLIYRDRSHPACRAQAAYCAVPPVRVSHIGGPCAPVCPARVQNAPTANLSLELPQLFTRALFLSTPIAVSPRLLLRSLLGK